MAFGAQRYEVLRYICRAKTIKSGPDMRTPRFLRTLGARGRAMLRDAGEALAPRHCIICHELLSREEEYVCTACYAQLPFTRTAAREGNAVERIFWAKIPVRRANALLLYHHGGPASEVAFNLKYGRNPDVGTAFGHIMAEDLAGTDFFQGIDAVVPVPLSPERERQRGYNQSYMLAQGIAQHVGLPVLDDAVVRTKDNPTQTGMTPQQRVENVRGIFRLARPEAVRGKHLLLVDDVVTTGATLLSLGTTLAQAEGVSLSIMTLFVAGRHSEGADIFDEDRFVNRMNTEIPHYT